MADPVAHGLHLRALGGLIEKDETGDTAHLSNLPLAGTCGRALGAACPGYFVLHF
jgi:hypothetical protein